MSYRAKNIPRLGGIYFKEAIKLVLVRLDQIYIGLLIIQFYVAYPKKKYLFSFVVGFWAFMSSLKAALHLISTRVGGLSATLRLLDCFTSS